MKVFKVFVLGLLYGWSLKYIIERIYQNDQVARLADENARLREHVRSLEAGIQRQPRGDASANRSMPQAGATHGAKKKDDLKVLKGIGPAAEKKLNQAGIHTFAALAQLSVEELQAILGSSSGMTARAREMMKEAKKLSQ